jgi:hypothetical protein
MRIKLGPILQDARGKLGSVVFSVWKTGKQYVRQTANIIANPNSTDQSAIRANMEMLSKYWYGTLTQDQRDGWATWALTKPGMGTGSGSIRDLIKGNTGIMSGFNAFCMANQWVYTGDPAASVVEDAPLGATPPTPPLSVTPIWTTPNLVVTWNGPDVKKTGAHCRLWITCRERGVHKQLIAVALATAGTISIAAVKGALGASIDLINAPGHYLVQMDTVDPDGTKSPGSVTMDVDIS